MNDTLLESPVLVEAYTTCPEIDIIDIPFPFEFIDNDNNNNNNNIENNQKSINEKGIFFFNAKY